MADLATPQEIADHYGRRVGYVYTLAHRNQWRRIKFQGRVYYRWSDADTILGRDALCATA